MTLERVLLQTIKFDLQVDFYYQCSGSTWIFTGLHILQNAIVLGDGFFKNVDGGGGSKEKIHQVCGRKISACVWNLVNVEMEGEGGGLNIPITLKSIQTNNTINKET